MYERQRPARHVRHDPAGDRLVVSGELNLRDVQVGIDESIRMRDADAGDGRPGVAGVDPLTPSRHRALLDFAGEIWVPVDALDSPRCLRKRRGASSIRCCCCGPTAFPTTAPA